MLKHLKVDGHSNGIASRGKGCTKKERGKEAKVRESVDKILEANRPVEHA